MAAAGWRDGRSAVIAGDLEGGGESSLLELGLNERWICDRTAQRESLGLDPWILMICGLRLGTKEKFVICRKSWKSGMFGLVLNNTTGCC